MELEEVVVVVVGKPVVRSDEGDCELQSRILMHCWDKILDNLPVGIKEKGFVKKSSILKRPLEEQRIVFYQTKQYYGMFVYLQAKHTRGLS